MTIVYDDVAEKEAGILTVDLKSYLSYSSNFVFPPIFDNNFVSQS